MTTKRSTLSSLVVLGAAFGCSSLGHDEHQPPANLETDLAERVSASGLATPLEASDGAISEEVRSLFAYGLTEEEAVKVALLNNREIRATLESLGVERADLLQAGLLANPVFTANAKFFEDAREIELELAESFVEIFFRPLRKSLAAAALREREGQVKSDVVRTVFDVRRAFVRVRAAQDVEELARHVLTAAEGSYDLMKALHEAGNVTDPLLTTEEAALGQARLDYAAAVSETVEVREPLNVLLGLWGDVTRWRIDGRLSELPSGESPEHLESRAVEKSLALASAKARAESAAQRAGLASWEGIFSTGEVGVVAKEETGAGWGFGPSIGIPIPIFDRGQARVASAEAQLREALHGYAASAVETRSAARVFRERVIALTERAAYLREVHIPVRARLVRETLQNYNAMQIGAFEVLLAKQQEIAAGREYVETLRDGHLARLDMEELLAGSLNHERLEAAVHREASYGSTRMTGEHK